MPRGPINCCDCGVLIDWPSQVQKRCHACAESKLKEHSREAGKRYYQRKMASEEGRAALRAAGRRRYDKHRKNPRPLTEQEGAPPSSQPPMKPQPAGDRWSTDGKRTAQVGYEAQALGLSYGRYVALMSCGMIDRHCRDMGIVDGPEFVRRAWMDFQREREARKGAARH